MKQFVFKITIVVMLIGAIAAGVVLGSGVSDKDDGNNARYYQNVNNDKSAKKQKNNNDDYIPADKNAHIATTADNVDANAYAAIPAGDALPAVTARSAVVMEAATGKVLYQRNMDQLRYPASTTKMMTLIVALENSKLDEVVTASSNASGTEGSTIWLEIGERLTMEQLMYGMMLVSGNDATVAVAEHIAGTVPKFAQMMTKKAHEIGAVNTHFANSSGLPDPEHYTTAYDLALIAAYGYQNPEFAKIVGTKEKQIPWSVNPYNRDLGNENRMLWLYDGGNGVKTGYTDAAGRCLVSAAKRDGVQLIAVVLDAPYMWNDSIAMLDYGFSRVYPLDVVKRGEKFDNIFIPFGENSNISAHARESITVGSDGSDRSAYTKKIELKEELKAPVKKGEIIGEVNVIYDGKIIRKTDLLSDENVNKAGMIKGTIDWVKSFFTK